MMKGFSLQPLLPSLKAKITALCQQDDRLYVGLATGSLQTYSYDPQSDGGLPSVKLLSSAVLGRKAIDQVGVSNASKQLLVLSDGAVTAYPLENLASAKGKVITQARNAHTLVIATYDPSTTKGKRSQDGAASASKGNTPGGDGLVDMVIIGCRKKVVVFSGIKPGFRDAWEIALPHSPRQIVVPSTSTRSPSFPETVHLLYSPTSSAILSISPTAPFLSVSDTPNAPPPPSISAVAGSGDGTGGAGVHESGSGLTGMGVGALTGLGGYVGLGSKAAAPVGCSIIDGEVLLGRDDMGAFLSSDASYTRSHSLQWPTSPDAISFSNPYIYSILPPAAGSSSSAPATLPCLSIHLGPSLLSRGSLQVPSPSAGSLSYSNLITTSQSPSRTPAEAVQPAAKLLFSSTPTDKALLAAEGSSIWALSTSNLEDHVDDLVREGRVADAIGLVESVGEAGFSPTRRLPHLKTLQAVTNFAKGQYQNAIETFLIFNINPALVISLYPAATISGQLHVPKDRWLEAFGAVPGARLSPEVAKSGSAEEGLAKGLLKSVTAAAGLSKRTSMDSIRTTATSSAADKKADEGSLNEKAPVFNDEEMPRAALEALMYYLSDRRQKVTGAINSLPEPGLPAESSLSPLSALPAEQLHQLPNLPYTELEPETLLRVAQVIYTGLLKVYLVARPILVGSLCRIENWCDVEEVEELLKAQKKFSDLIDLYQGKKMHGKALKMLHELALEEDDRLDRYPLTVRYLQKLGPSELDLILETSKWIFKEDPVMALQIFTADEPEVDALPRKDVVQFLESTHEPSCVSYLQHIIGALKETGSDFHDKLAELLLAEAKGSGSEDGSPTYQRLLSFLSSSEHYRSNRLLTRIPTESMPEARAILLGRMGKHEDALRLYIYRLTDHAAAERYCAKVFATEPNPKGIFLLLLRLYLRPSPSDPVLLTPALGLITSQGTRLDAKEVLEMLPPLVTMEDVRAFLVKTLREGRKRRNEARIVRGLVGARKEEVERALMDLQGNRVRITDQRICPQCHKRLGQSAIAVHAPRGEVTHLHCKDPFSGQLAKARG